MIKLIVGLGNPGTKYAQTRHNLGFMAIDRLLEQTPVLKSQTLHNTLLYETRDFGLLCKPMTYMNRSGKALVALQAEFELQPGEMLVLYDDFALELGSIRVRPHGTAGGHKGLQSVIDCLATTHVPRVRLGILTESATPENRVDFVLEDFRRSEMPVVAEMLDLCSDAVSVILKDGITAAMNRFNRKQKPASRNNAAAQRVQS